MKDLYYEITEDGYHIYDHNDSLFHIHQYEPYIPDSSKSYEENAQAQIESLTTTPEVDGQSVIDEIIQEVAEDEQQDTTPSE